MPSDRFTVQYLGGFKTKGYVCIWWRICIKVLSVYFTYLRGFHIKPMTILSDALEDLADVIKCIKFVVNWLKGFCRRGT
jgi:hypothetical protein